RPRPAATSTPAPAGKSMTIQGPRFHTRGGTRFAKPETKSEPLGEQGMTRTIWAAVVAGIMILFGGPAPAWATSRLQGLANIEGVRQNQLIGYGLVVGLNGTGDTLNNIPFTRQSLQAMLERLGVNVRGAQMRTGNVAAVMVTANLPAFATQGTRMDVTVS